VSSELQPGEVSSLGLDGLVDTLMHPLRHIRCPECGIRFGIEQAEVAFMEQTSVRLWCPKGHRLWLRGKETA
jgi:hypothetical protein